MLVLVWTIVGFAVGLLVGWNLLPQPAWVKKLWTKAEDKIEDLTDKE